MEKSGILGTKKPNDGELQRTRVLSLWGWRRVPVAGICKGLSGGVET